MRWITTCFIIFPFLNPAVAQTQEELAALSAVFDPAPRVQAYDYARRDIETEYTWTLSRLFLFYKKYISSQDGGSCSFAPSCSEYAILSIKKYGFAAGALRAVDRLARCHPGAGSYYPVHPERRALHDPVE